MEIREGPEPDDVVIELDADLRLQNPAQNQECSCERISCNTPEGTTLDSRDAPSDVAGVVRGQECHHRRNTVRRKELPHSPLIRFTVTSIT